MAGKAVNELGAIYFSKELILIDITSCLLFILLIFLFYSKMFPRKYFAPNLNGVRLEARREPTFKR